MSNVQPEEVSVVVERDGIKTEKTFEPDDFPVPAIAFAFTSERDEPVEVRLVDRVPEDIPAEDIGFHPKYGAEFWSVEGETIVFEREFEPGEEYTTVYGLRAKDTDRADRFLGEPDLARVHPELEDASRAVRDVIGEIDLDESAGDAATGTDAGTATGTGTGTETGTGTGTETGTASGAGVSSEDLETAVSSVETGRDVESAVSSVEASTDADPSESTGRSIESTERSIESAERSVEPGATGGAPDPAIVDVGDRATGAEDVASTLAAELREGSVADRDLRVLREALDVEESGSERARIARLQQDVSDLRAYTDALESFLDEEGEAQTLLRELRSDIVALEERVQAGTARADKAADRAGEAVDRVGAVDDEISELSGDVAEIADTVDELSQLEARVDELSRLEARVDELDQLEARVDELSRLEARVDELSQLEARVDELSRLEARVDELSELEARVDALSDLPRRVDAIGSEFDRVEGDIADVEASVEELGDDLESTADTVDSIDDRVETIERGLGDVDAVDERLADIEEDLAGLQSVEDRMEELETRIEEAQKDLEEFAQMRDQLSSVFGSGQGGGDDS